MSNDKVRLAATGDVGPAHGPSDGFTIASYSELAKETLKQFDLRVGNCERQYSRRGAKADFSSARAHARQDPAMAQIFQDFGFDVLSLANNHMYDFGPDALCDTRQLLIDMGISVTGAGRDLTEAKEPAVVSRNGISVGFLSYSSVVPAGASAGEGKAGVMELRTHALYDIRGVHSPVRVHSYAEPRDLEMIIDDIKALRSRVDVVVPAFHWGVLHAPRIISDYQVEVAHACIDAGAEMVLGHHVHVPKAIEVYRGKPIFYSLGNFCITSGSYGKQAYWQEAPWKHGALRNHTDQDAAYPLLPYGKASRYSLIATAILSSDGIESAGFLPVMIDQQYRPEVLSAGDSRFSEVAEYIDWASEGFDHSFKVEGSEVTLDIGFELGKYSVKPSR